MGVDEPGTITSALSTEAAGWPVESATRERCLQRTGDLRAYKAGEEPIQADYKLESSWQFQVYSASLGRFSEPRLDAQQPGGRAVGPPYITVALPSLGSHRRRAGTATYLRQRETGQGQFNKSLNRAAGQKLRAHWPCALWV